MTMKTAYISSEAAEDGLVRLAGHVPPSVAIGRPLVATSDGDGVVHLLAGEDDMLELWAISEGEAERLVPLPGDRAEVTCWRRGIEVSRRCIGPVD